MSALIPRTISIGSRTIGSILSRTYIRYISNVYNCVLVINMIMLLFDDNKVKMARKPGKKQQENPVECTGEGTR